MYESVTSSPVSGDVQLVELRFQPPIILNRLAAAAKTAGDSQIETDSTGCTSCTWTGVGEVMS